MSFAKPLAPISFLLLGILMLTPGCVVEPHEGYYDRDHHRWYHEHGWHECTENDVHCAH